MKTTAERLTWAREKKGMKKSDLQRAAGIKSASTPSKPVPIWTGFILAENFDLSKIIVDLRFDLSNTLVTRYRNARTDRR